MARKSKKVDFVNVNDLPGGSGAQAQIVPAGTGLCGNGELY